MSSDFLSPTSRTAVLFPRPLMFVKTLGHLEVLHHRKSVTWVGGGAGRHQLRRQLSCLVAHRDQFVPNWRLLEAAGKRAIDRVNPTYVINGICQFLKRHGLKQVLHRSKHGVILHAGDSWKTDTDVLQSCYIQAQDRLHAGDSAGALTLLDTMITTNTVAFGQEYMVELCQHLPNDLYLHQQATRWRNIQRNAIRLLVEHLLRDPPTSHQQRHRPLDLATLVLGLDRPGAFDYRLAAQAAAYADLHDLADLYRKQADSAAAADDA